MKRLFTLFIIACILGGNAWGGIVYFQNNVVEYKKTVSPVEEPEQINGHYFFKQDVWYLDHEGDTPVNLGILKNEHDEFLQDVDFVWSVDVTGNITIPNDYVDYHSGNHYELKQGTGFGSNIYFDCTSGGSGTLTVTATNPDYYGQVYTCTYTINYHTDVKTVKWDFCGKKVTSDRISEKTDLATYWTLSDIPAFQTTYAGAGNNEATATALYWFKDPNNTFTTGAYADFIGVASGLTFKSDAVNKIGICNESLTDVNNAHRCVALKTGASFCIPSSTFSNMTVDHPRIRIKMGRYGGTDDDVSAHLTITNAQDAIGTAITGTGTYHIGGSSWWGDKGDNNQRGEYHFSVIDKNQDFTITVADGQWIMLYTIEVYDSENRISENSVLGDKYQLLNVGGTKGSAGVSSSYWLHYRGKGEKTTLTSNSSNYMSGTVLWEYEDPAATPGEADHFDALANATKHTFTSKIGEFGTFYIILRSMDQSGTYCTDYADRRMAVGYRSIPSYPYTWDFTDVKNYIIGEDKYYEGFYQNEDRNLWSTRGSGDAESHGLRVAQDGGKNILYCGGSELWFGKNTIAETAGLAFTPVNSDKTYNDALNITNNGFLFNQNIRDWWGWRVTVPSVPAGGAVYIRAKDAGASASMRHVKYYIGSGVNNKTNMTEFAASAAPANKLQVSGSSDEYIYAVYNNGGSANDITFFFNQVEVQKIAVSTDKKTFNAKGWTTESRDHDIDPSLTAEMNGRGIKTYAVTDVNYANKHVTMTDISNAGLMHAATDDSQYACILRNTADNTFEVVNGGFYLFVPDMHDEQGSTTGEGYKLKSYATAMESSKMKAKVNYAVPSTMIDGTTYKSDKNTPPIPATSGSYTNFAFTYQYYQLDDDGNRTTSEKLNGPQGFYRIAAGGAYSLGNQGYLPLETSKLSTDVVNSARGFELAFDDDEESGEATAIENIEVNMSETTAKTAVYYSLSGQQLSGKPAKGGIYICNGKKVIIK